MREIKKEILKKLAEIEQKENVKVLYAVESGSRAWGVESPDSDDDVRFVYVRTQEDYLSLQEKRDVIEWQLDEVLDINGWDLRKTLIQFRKGNATLFEWANSPVVYKTTDAWEQIREVGKQYFSKKVALYHYYGTANSTFCQFLQGEEVKYKKYIYALRPLLACKYIEQYETIPPVKFEDLLKQSLPKELTDEIQTMLEGVVAQYPWSIAFVFFLVSVLINSQGAVVVAMLPLAYQLGIPGAVLLGVLPSVYGYFFIPNYPSDIATVNFDRSGTTVIGKYLLNHSFMMPGMICVVVSTLAAYVLSMIIF